MPKHFSDDIALVAMHLASSRSEIFRKLVSEYLEKSEPINTIVEKTSKRIIKAWRSQRKLKGGAPSLKLFLEGVTESLERKRISATHIQMILDKTKEIHDANQSAKNK